MKKPAVRRLFPIYIVLVLAAIGLNIGMGQFMIQLKIPLYMDSIGTVVVAVLLGPWAGGVTGFLTNLTWTATDLFPQAVAWVGVSSIVGILADFFNQINFMQKWIRAAFSGIVTGVIAAILSAPIAAYVFGGVTGTGTDSIVNMFSHAGIDMLGANMAQGAVSDPLDKLITFSLAWLVLRLIPENIKKHLREDAPL